MDKRLKKICELSKQVVFQNNDIENMTKEILKLYPDLKKYKFKTNEDSIRIGTYLKCVTNDLKHIIEGNVSSVKYTTNYENQQKTIFSIIIVNTNTEKKWKKIYPNNYYLFVDIYPESKTTKLIKQIIKSKKYSDYDYDELFDEIYENSNDNNMEEFFLEQIDIYNKNNKNN